MTANPTDSVCVCVTGLALDAPPTGVFLGIEDIECFDYVALTVHALAKQVGAEVVIVMRSVNKDSRDGFNPNLIPSTVQYPLAARGVV